MMDGRIERLLERIGLRMEPFPAGFASFVQIVPERTFIGNASFGWQEMKIRLDQPQEVVWRGNFTTDDKAYGWSNYEVVTTDKTFLTKDTSVNINWTYTPSVSEGSALPTTHTFTYTSQGY